MGRKLAAFWRHAERMGNRFKCKFCKQVFPGGVVRLRAHLSGITGQGIQVCSKVPEDVKSSALLASNNGPIKKKSKTETGSSNSDNTSSEICDARCSNEVDSSLAKFFEMNNISCSIVESPSFLNLVNVLIKSGSGYVLPSCSTLENQLILSLRKEVEKYISVARQSWEEIGCTLIFDIWRSEKEKRSFISIIACSGKRAVLLNTFEIPDNNLTASFLEKVVHHVVEYVGPDKVIQYFVDETQCSEEIAKLLTSKCPHVFTTRCVVRELESFFEEVHQEVEWIRATFETAKCLVDAMYKDCDLLALMRKYTGGKELKQSPGYDMLESIFEVKEDLVKFAQSPEWLASGYDQQENGKKSTAIITSEEFWKQGEEVLMALKPLFTILHLDDTADSSFGYLYGLVKVAEEVIAHLQTNKQEKYQKLWSIFELKKNRIIHETHKAAAFLNPAYLCNATGQDITQMEEGINYIIHKFVADDDREAFVEQAMHYRRTLSDPHELFKTIAAKTSTPCEWWNGFGETFSVLKKHATKILCQPCGSSSYKSGLGAFQANLVKQRGMVPELNDLNVRMNLFLMEKYNADNEDQKRKRINFEEFGKQQSTNGSSDAALVEPRHSDDETRLSTTREELPGPKPMKLCFMTVVASPILTGQKVEGYQGCRIHVYIADSATDCVVQDGSPSTLTLTISVLDGDFTNEAPSDECHTREYFDSNDLSSDMMPLVTGDLQLTLVQGVGLLGEFSFNYNSRGTRSGKFRLAVKTFTGDCEGIRILEGISNAFVVDDNEVTRTQHPAALEMHLPKDSASLVVISPMEGWWGALEQTTLGESSGSPGDWNGPIWNYNHLQRSCRSLTQTAARRVKKKSLLLRYRSCNLRIKMKKPPLEPLDKEKIGNEVEAGEGVTLGKNQQEDYEENGEPMAVLKEIGSSGTERRLREDTYEVLSLKHLSTAMQLSLTRDKPLEPREGADPTVSTSGNSVNHQKEVNDDPVAGDCVSPKAKSPAVMLFGVTVNDSSVPQDTHEVQSPSHPSPAVQLSEVNEFVESGRELHSISTRGNNVNPQDDMPVQIEAREQVMMDSSDFSYFVPPLSLSIGRHDNEDNPSASPDLDRKLFGFRLSDLVLTSKDKGGAVVTPKEKPLRSVFEIDCVPLWGSVSLCGKRPQMEDAVAAKPRFLRIPIKMLIGDQAVGGLSQSLTHVTSHFYGVYDGHGSAQVANYCRDRMHFALAEQILAAKADSLDEPNQLQWERIFTNCFQRVDDEIGGKVGIGRITEDGDSSFSSLTCSEPLAPDTVGSTAAVALVCSSCIIVANCGDSRAVLLRGNKSMALSIDHRPDSNPSECSRIEAAGGNLVKWNGYRVFGVLAMSRSIGDGYLKPWITPEPEVTIIPRARDDDCLVIASDGLWDVMTNEEVCELARKRILAWHKKNGSTPSLMVDRGQGVDPASQSAAEYLAKLAIEKGSKDNISVIVVDLKLQRKFRPNLETLMGVQKRV